MSIKTTRIHDAGKAWAEVDFFLRLHRHLPDEICGGGTKDGMYAPFANCIYRKDGRPINRQNDYVEKLKLNEDFIKAEKEVDEAVANGKAVYQGELLTAKEAVLLTMKEAG